MILMLHLEDKDFFLTVHIQMQNFLFWIIFIRWTMWQGGKGRSINGKEN